MLTKTPQTVEEMEWRVKRCPDVAQKILESIRRGEIKLQQAKKEEASNNDTTKH